MREYVASLLDGPLPGDDDNLLDHGLDSVRLMMVADRLGVDFTDLAERPTLRAWAELAGD
ncbi:bifunctional isochorismate lyase/aryl carrier protein [Streptosporangium becharense]|uniref:Bifunctional isochorismate lyase/aryl carrier protein n=1 Tax=Streptosporangium becharense TaxID=1816182 RepID=A0A7W9IAX2_9ACTN|nr:phosphopantetheine-binding protein [Streptosporangium becharense]MBB2910628.1 bifunctional isochorismate lyase/aryl carrier protein [Streptosporangium becharense]MBB5817324.1 bifunctional isochorismate lyase/aryl carrier protein [Streptosporangium becharense]